MEKEYGIIITAIVVIGVFGYWALQNPQIAVNTGSNLIDSGKTVVYAGDQILTQVCPIGDKILSSINDNFIQNLKDKKTKQLAIKIMNNTATDCDIQMFYGLLSEDERKKINWLDFTCNLKACGLG